MKNTTLTFFPPNTKRQETHVWKFLACLLTTLCLTTQAQVTSTFEMRYFSNNPKANGENDFHGETEVWNTDERIDALTHYADFASKFWGDPELNTPLITDEEVSELTAAIKPQPTTDIRKTMRLNGWHAYGYKQGKEIDQAARWKEWTAKGARISGGCLWLKDAETAPKIKAMDWRFRLKMTLKDMPEGMNIVFSNGGKHVIEVCLDKETVIATSGFLKKTAKVSGMKDVEVYGDLPSKRFFVTINGKTTVECNIDDNCSKTINQFAIQAKTNGHAAIDNISLFHFERHEENLKTPYYSDRLLSEDFNEVPSIRAWQSIDYDDNAWETVDLPSPHGALQEAGESYYLRKKIMVGQFTHAMLNIETLDPAGEVWINSQPVAVLKGRQPRSLDVSDYLLPEKENVIAIRVKPYEAKNRMLHAPSDINIGWFLGRTELILCNKKHIAQVLTHTASLDDNAAIQRHKIHISNELVGNSKATVEIKYYPWYPEEGDCVATIEKDIELRPMFDNAFDIDLPIRQPNLWGTKEPHLYKVQVVLKDSEGNAIDDYVTTTGIRLIEQREGTLYINHHPEMLNGAQNFGYRTPVETTAKYIRCAKDEMVMRDLLMIKKMNANLLRIHVHAEKDTIEGINDPRYAEYADQMGIYLIWQTAGWIREGEAWNVDIKHYPEYMRQVYNHPSIVLWEASNHPNKFKEHDVSETVDYFTSIISTIAQTDTSRLISPTSYWPHSHYINYDGTQTINGTVLAPNIWLRHKMMTRGSQDAYSGYGNKWEQIRKMPYPWAKSCLEANELCYFNFEHEESAAQPNWKLARKEPWYEVQSYEWEYEQGSIGRFLQTDEWRQSQAYQAFSAWESMKKQTLMGVDGFSWCSLESGPNMFTYQKPLIDPFNVPKLAYHANKMAFNRIWAASDDVDVIYGPADMVRPVVFNLEETCKVNLTVELKNEKGKTLERKTFKNVNIEEGRSITHLKPFRFKDKGEGCRFIVYNIKKIL